ncbi:MAG TPA: ATP-dependent DNA ligase [Nitrososphaeria archaeon]|nr:ATP-dependent DNA ligase [Nitrososphaeria archaeon]
MKSVLYAELAKTCEILESLSGKKDKVAQVVKFLKTLSPEEAPPAALLLIGRTMPEGSEEKLEVNAAAIFELLEESGQSILDSSPPPTILEVWNTLRRISELRGPGSRAKKLELLRSLLYRMGEVEKRWFLKQLMGEMQHGVNEGLLLEAIAELTNMDLKKVQRAYMLLGKIGDLVEVAVREGKRGLEAVRLTLFRPLRPMLAEMCHDVRELLKESGQPLAFEYKFDGARVQIHVQGDVVRIFSRRLSDVTESLPDVVDQVKSCLRGVREAVLDGEAVAVDEEGRPLPFQELLRRFRRIRNVLEESERIPLKLWIFDVLYLNGIDLLDQPYRVRRKKLEEIVDRRYLTPMIVTSDPDEVVKFLERAIREGHEGLMIKKLGSPYRPGRREKLWLKLKPAENLDLVIVAADWGHGRRTGWLSNYHLAAYNPETGGFEVVGKTFKGLTDDEFEWMTKRLLELKLEDDGYTVKVRPKIVVEVAYNEIQRSPKYRSGYALRFARIIRIRDDKRPEEADTIQKIRELYLKQFERKRLPSESVILGSRGRPLS